MGPGAERLRAVLTVQHDVNAMDLFPANYSSTPCTDALRKMDLL